MRIQWEYGRLLVSFDVDNLDEKSVSFQLASSKETTVFKDQLEAFAQLGAAGWELVTYEPILTKVRRIDLTISQVNFSGERVRNTEGHYGPQLDVTDKLYTFKRPIEIRGES